MPRRLMGAKVRSGLYAPTSLGLPIIHADVHDDNRYLSDAGDGDIESLDIVCKSHRQGPHHVQKYKLVGGEHCTEF